ncbi:MAG: hypothetical protein V1668_02015 [Patescibacteria group bacterium]
MVTTNRQMYLFTALGAAVIAGILLYIPGIYDLGSRTVGFYPVGIVGMWGIPVALAISIALLVSNREKDRRTLKLFVYPVMYLLIFCLVMVVTELVVHSPFKMYTVASGNRYSDFSVHAVFTFLGLPFSIAMGVIIGFISSVVSFFRRKDFHREEPPQIESVE